MSLPVFGVEPPKDENKLFPRRQGVERYPPTTYPRGAVVTLCGLCALMSETLAVDGFKIFPGGVVNTLPP